MPISYLFVLFHLLIEYVLGDSSPASLCVWASSGAGLTRACSVCNAALVLRRTGLPCLLRAAFARWLA